MKTGIEQIAEERQRQITEEGWTPEHDWQHDNGSLALAAACYALPPHVTAEWNIIAHLWPWYRDQYKPCPFNRIKELVKAGALIAAEIDRLGRLQRKGARA